MNILKDIKLKILVFGPNPSTPSGAGFTKDLANKRVEIKNALIKDGHMAVFPEDLLKGSADPDLDNTFLWEQMLVIEYDMVVNLVGSFGAVSELALFQKKNLAQKACLFFEKGHMDGLPYSHAQMIQRLGATLNVYNYPLDLTSCNLMKSVREKANDLKISKFYNS